MLDSGHPSDEVFGVRVAGLPVEGLQGQRYVRTWALVDESLETTRWLADEGAALSDLLHDLIGTEPDLRSPLVALRRAIFAAKRPTTLDRVRHALPTGLATRIDLWRSRLDRRGELAALLAPTLADETAERTATLRDVVADPAFRHGLGLSSPTLAAELTKWLDDPAAVPGRQGLLRLARYAARVSTKTSPYSTFTINGLGRWRGGGARLSTPGTLNWHRVGEFDLRTVWRIWERLAQRPELRHALRVRVNASLTHEDGRLWFLGPAPREQVLSMPADPAVVDVLDRIREFSTPPNQLEQLVELGLVERRRPFDDQAADPLGALLAWLEVATHGRSPELAALRELHGQVRAQELPDPERIRELTGGAPVKGVYLDTAVCPEDMAVCDERAWQPIMRDLDVVRRFLGLLDNDLSVKLTAAAFFLDHYGPDEEVPFLRFYRQTHVACPELLNLRYGGVEPDLPQVRELYELRSAAWQALYDLPRDERGVIVAPAEVVEKMMASWPDHIRPPGSLSCYGQLAGEDFVLNTVFSGYGRHVARIRHLLGDGSSVAAEPEQAGSPESAGGGRKPYRIVECRGSFGTNLNLRAAAAEAIDYPFTVTAEPRFALGELRVCQVDGRPALRDPDGALITPAHLGMTSQLTLPPAWSFLISVFGEPPMAMPPAWRIDLYAAPEGVRHRPRLQIGRVVLTRARWIMYAAELPVPAKGEAEGAYLIRMATWLRRHGMPRRFFARVYTRGSASRKTRKPLYVDVTDHFLLLSLTRSAREPGDMVILEEALPDPAEAPGYGPHGRRVTEYVLAVDER